MLSVGGCNSLLNAVYSVFKQALNTNLSQDVPLELSSALDQNVFFFSGFKTFRELQEVSSLLKDSSGTFKSFDMFKLEASKVGKIYNENYLRAEYNFAVQSCQMAVKWNEYAKDGDNYYLQYRTANDGKVRPAHQALNKTTLPFSDKFWNNYYPPLDWNCRCTVVQVRKNKYPLSDSDKAIKQGELATDTPKKKMFRFNAGKEMKIFPSKHPYLPKGCGECEFKKQRHLAYNPASPQCQVCNTLESLIQTEQKRKLTTEEKRQIRITYTQWIKKHLPEVNVNGDTARRKIITTTEQHNVIVNKVFFSETFAKNNRNSKLAETIQVATEFEKWMHSMKYIRTEIGKHHNFDFKVYNATYKNYIIELKVKITAGNIAYNMRLL
ncbi:MAG: minor capsid protein [Bacteroidales bacterium]|nr:minor capsid protein [Bacteroidales bacterium]